MSLYDGQVAWTSYQALNYFATGEPPGRMGSKHPNIVPYQAFETEDGYVVVACPTENFWTSLCEAIGRPELAEQERFRTNEKRVENREELDRILGEAFLEYETAEVLDRLGEAGVPASDVRDVEEVFDDPQTEARGMRQSVEHPTAGDVEMPGSPMHFSRTPARVKRHPPLLGEHTEEVLREYGYREEDLGLLREEGVISE